MAARAQFARINQTSRAADFDQRMAEIGLHNFCKWPTMSHSAIGSVKVHIIEFVRNGNVSARGRVSGIVGGFATERFLGSFSFVKEQP